MPRLTICGSWAAGGLVHERGATVLRISFCAHPALFLGKADVLFHEAVAVCLHDGLTRTGALLEQGALQCHWRLELTPKGVDTAQPLIG